MDARAEKIYRSAIAEHPELRAFGKKKITGIIRSELARIGDFETAAEADKKRHFAMDPRTAEKIGVIWVFSGPGSYKEPFLRDDKFGSYPWARWMDRDRLDRAATLAVNIAGISSGQAFAKGPRFSFSSPERKEIGAIREAVRIFAPIIVYNGYEEQNAILKKVLVRKETIIPAEKVKIIGKRLLATPDQIKSFAMPSGRKRSKKGIALISHAPHLDRILHMIRRYRPLPSGSVPYLFPLATPRGGKSRFAELEIKGLLYYIFLSKNKDAAEKIYPYII